jgi:biopolymer transport protein TolR
VFFGENEVRDDEIVPRLTANASQGLEERVFVRGDKRVDYGRVAQVMSIVTAAGFKRVALVTEMDAK